MTEVSNEEPPASIVSLHEDVVRAAAEELRAAGWSVAWSWQLPDSPFDLSTERRVCAGSVDAPDAVADAVLAAVRGVVVVVHCPDPGRLATLIDELARVTKTEHRDATERGPALRDEAREILELLAGGATMTEVAAQLFLSMRTAERRLASARKALGVATTAEAIAAYRRLT